MRPLKRPPMPGAGRPGRGNVKRVLVSLAADELRRLEWLQKEMGVTASEVLRVLIDDAYETAKADR